MKIKLYVPENKELKHLNPRFYIREGSSDIKSVNETWTKKQYQRPSLKFIIEPGERWLDLGANIGAFTVYAALKGAVVKAYEAQKDNAGIIRKNAVLNSVSDRIEVIQAAIVPPSIDGRTLRFYESTNPASFRRHTLYGNYLNSARKKTVRVTSVKGIGFDRILIDGYDCIKMNIEGAEIPIIEELQPGLSIRKMVFEYSFDMDKRIATFTRTIEQLQRLFEVVVPARKIPLHLETYPYFPPNCYIFCMNGRPAKN